MQLRGYQIDAIESARESIRRGNKRIILQANCGAGKTILACSIIQSALGKGKKVIFLVHLRQLAYQAMERFTEFGLGDEVGYIMAGEQAHLSRPVQIISVQTYGRRLELESLDFNPWFKSADIVFYDEAHASIAKTRKAVLDLYRDDSIIIGLTATPCRADGRPLSSIYQDIVQCSSVKSLTEQGYLVPARYFVSKELPDLDGVKTVLGDYNQRELGTRVDKPKLVGGILENFLRISGTRQGVCFATNVKHSKHIMELFNHHGIVTEHIDARTPHDERRGILSRFKGGDTQVVTNVGVFSEGADFPWAETVVLAKPSKSFARYIQMASRGLRPYPGKESCIIIDHARLIETHGVLDCDVEWTLSGKEKAWKKKKKPEKEPKQIECNVCGAVYQSAKYCPECGSELKTHGKEIKTTDEDLVEINKTTKKIYSMADKQRWWGMLEYYRREKGYKEGWTTANYKDRIGAWPRDAKDSNPIEPDEECLRWLQYKRIKWAKRRQNA